MTVFALLFSLSAFAGKSHSCAKNCSSLDPLDAKSCITLCQEHFVILGGYPIEVDTAKRLKTARLQR